MELDKAKETVKILAHGIDPVTGEVLPQESPYNDPGVIRSLFTVLESIKSSKQPRKTNEQRQQDNIAAGRPKNAGLPWTEESRAEVATRFRKGTSIDALSQHFERTKFAIESELVKQGLIESSETPARR
jgi:hypothetical protein